MIKVLNLKILMIYFLYLSIFSFLFGFVPGYVLASGLLFFQRVVLPETLLRPLNEAMALFQQGHLSASYNRFVDAEEHFRGAPWIERFKTLLFLSFQKAAFKDLARLGAHLAESRIHHQKK